MVLPFQRIQGAEQRLEPLSLTPLSTGLLKLPQHCNQTSEEHWRLARPTLPSWTIYFNADILAKFLRTTWYEQCPPQRKAPKQPFVAPMMWDVVLAQAHQRSTFVSGVSCLQEKGSSNCFIHGISWQGVRLG